MKNIPDIKKFTDYIKESVFDGNELIYMSFDVDDNLLHMPTQIHMDHLVNGEWVDERIDTETFAIIRNDKNWRFKEGHGGDESFVEFRDWGTNGDNTFIKHFKEAVKNRNFGPSWNKFIECLVNGHIFSIITSRGHSPNNVHRAIQWLIYDYGLNNFKHLPIENVDKFESLEDQMIINLLSYHELFGSSPDAVIDQYLEYCPIYTITSDKFKEQFGKMPVEEAKKLALNDFNNLVQYYAEKIGFNAKYGFSDDDPKFVKSAIDQFTELKDKNKNIKYTVFDTGGDKKIKKINI